MGSTPINISGSRSSAILGLSPYQTQIDIWLTMMEEIEPGFCENNKYVLPEKPDNASIRFGNAFEDSIIMLYEEQNGVKVSDREKLFIKDFLSCHVDGIVGDILIENKTTSQYYFNDNFGEPGTDRIPMNYMCQVQHNLMCTGLSSCDLSVLVFPKRQDEFEAMGWMVEINNNIYRLVNKNMTYTKLGYGVQYPSEWARTLAEMGYFHTYHIEPNEKLQSLMLQKYEQFWNVNIIGKQIPEIQTLDDIKKIYTEPKGTVVADEEIERISMERKLIQKEISEMKKNVDKLKLIEQQYLYDHAGEVIDEETREKTFLLDRAGKKLASYSKSGGMR